MCGITGYLSSNINKSPEESNNIINSMTDSLIHRGPDSKGIWQDLSSGIVMGFRRLAIQDISDNGNQPMRSGSGRYVIVFNGEIYNHNDLRKEILDSIPGHRWRSTSDTETLLAGIELWGIEDTLKKCSGMFGLAVWCMKTQVLTLARDRVGEKPIYYGWQKNSNESVFFFGSELKAFHHHPSFKKEINRDSISSFVRLSYVPAPNSIYKNIFKLLPGHMVTISLKSPEPKVHQYWSAVNLALKSNKKNIFSNDHEATNALEKTLKTSINKQMISDVPIGAFLSGGVDSSTVVSLMQAQSMERIKTFTIGFGNETFNEANDAKAVAEHLQTDHSELYIEPNDLLNVIPRLSQLYDEPFGDSSQIPTYLISQFAKKNVSVALSGDGGDELFCGYNRYQITDRYWGKIKILPKFFRNFLAKNIQKFTPSQLEKLAYIFNNSRHSYSNFGNKVLKGANVLASKDVISLYMGMISTETKPNDVVLNGFEDNQYLLSNIQTAQSQDEISMMMLVDLLTYLPDDILVKVDRAAMGVSLETRVPMLDENVIKFALSLPLNYKLRGGQSKWLLKEVLYRYVPKQLIERPKSGFAIPIGEWLQNDLKEWAEDLLDESNMIKQGIFNASLVQDRWRQHLAGVNNWEHFIWNILMFQSWYKNFHEKA